MQAGDTFLLKAKAVEGGHPWILISDPHAGLVVIVNITAWTAYKDQSCILEAGEDGIVKKRSIVSYRDATIVADAKLIELEKSGEIIVTSPVSRETLTKILSGCGITRFMKQGPYDLLDKLGLIPVT